MNYVITLAQILEISFSKLGFHEILCVKMLIQVPQTRNKSSIMELAIWGNLGNIILQFCNINDFILIEGYLAGINSYKYIQKSVTKTFKIIQINAIKIHPITLNSQFNQN